MAPAVTYEDWAFDFHRALSSYKSASTDEERSVAGYRLRAELEDQKLRLEDAYERERVTRVGEYMRELARLEEQLQADLMEKDKVTAVRKACLELCLSKMDTDPEESALFGNVILSWAAKTRSVPPRVDEVLKGMKKLPAEIIMHDIVGPRAAVRVAKMKPEEVHRMAADLEVFLKNRGFAIPTSELYAGLSGTVRIEKARASKYQKWNNVAGAVSMGVAVVTNVVTTVQSLKHVRPDDAEPLLTCRHYLPDGWFF